MIWIDFWQRASSGCKDRGMRERSTWRTELKTFTFGQACFFSLISCGWIPSCSTCLLASLGDRKRCANVEWVFWTGLPSWDALHNDKWTHMHVPSPKMGGKIPRFWLLSSPKRQVNIAEMFHKSLESKAISGQGNLLLSRQVSDTWKIFPMWVIAERMGEPVIRRGTKLAFVPTKERKIKQRDQMTYWRKTNRRGLRLEGGKKQWRKMDLLSSHSFSFFSLFLYPAQALDSLCWYTQYLLPERSSFFPSPLL